MDIRFIRRMIVDKFHVLPIVVVVIQTFFYYQFFFDRETYLVYMALYDQIFKDSLFVLLIMFFTIKKWYLLNTVFMLGLVYHFIINTYAIIFGLSEDAYFILIIFIEYSLYIISTIYTLINLNK